MMIVYYKLENGKTVTTLKEARTSGQEFETVIRACPSLKSAEELLEKLREG